MIWKPQITPTNLRWASITDICYHKFLNGSKTCEISSISQILGPPITFVNYNLLQTRLRPGFLFSRALGLNLKFWAWNGLKSEQNPQGNVIAIDGKPVNMLQLNTNHVFTFEGKAINGVKSSFRTAVKNAGIEDFHFHNLRHTFASQLIMKGGDLKDVQEILGHKTMTMTLRYAHLSQHNKKKAVNLLNGLTAKSSVLQKPDWWKATICK